MRTLRWMMAFFVLATTSVAAQQDSATVTATWESRGAASSYRVLWTGDDWVRGPLSTTQTTMTIKAPMRDTSYVVTACVDWVHKNNNIIRPAGCSSDTVPGLPPQPIRDVTVVVTIPDTITPEPPPPGDRWPNEPADFELHMDVSWDSKNPPNQPRCTWAESNEWSGSGVTINQTSTAQESPPNVVRWTWEAGRSGGDSPGRNVCWTPDGGDFDYYIGAWVRWSPNWTNHPSGINKILYWGEGHASDLGNSTNQFMLNRRDNVVDVMLQWGQPGGGQRPIPWIETEPRLASTNVGDGQWHLVEMVANGSTDGLLNGRMRVWVDGILQFDVSGISYTFTGRTQFYGVDADPVWGGVGGTKPATEWFEIDHLRTSGR